MKKLLFVVLLFAAGSAHSQSSAIDVDRQLQLSMAQYRHMLEEFRDTSLFPQSVNPDGTYRKEKSSWWCTGFFAGTLWYMYEYSKDKDLKLAAEKWTAPLAKQQYNQGTHDLGFMLYCSFGNGYRLTHKSEYKDVLLQGASSLATRFDPSVGVIKSWNNFKGYKYPVIIDNMMNLELLMWASKRGGGDRLRDIAIHHADKTMLNHYRPDYSSYHVVAYDSLGNVLAKKTAQGYADNSAWARGQAWGLYGYTMMYRETKDKRYLDQALHIADFLIHHPSLAPDKIFYWDLDRPGEERDVSASAIASSALLELSRYAPKARSGEYYSFAVQVLQSLSTPAYFTPEGNHYFILKHSVGSKPGHSEVDTPIIYADYYYIEALLRFRDMVRK